MYTAWTYSRTLKFNTTASGADIPGNVANFPLLIRLDATNFDFGQAASDGRDIRFEEAGNLGALSYQIERWDASAQVAEVWVKVPQIDGNSLTDYIYMYWGNGSATSESNGANVFQSGSGFRGVWHLSEDGNTTTSNYLNASANSSLGTGLALTNTSDVVGQIGIASNFVGTSNNGISIPHATTLNATSALTIEAWINPTTLGPSRKIISKSYVSASSPWNEFSLETDASVGDKIRFSLTLGGVEASISSTSSLASGTWYHIVGVWDGGAQRIFINGMEESNLTRFGSITNYSQPIVIGKGPFDNATNFNGLIDEPRMAIVARNSDWIKLSYASQKNGQGLFLSVTKTASVTGNWNNTGTWGGASLPTASDSILINSGVTVTLTSDLTTTGTIILSGSGTIEMNGFNLKANSLVSSGSSIINNSGASKTVSIMLMSGTATFSGILSGSIALIKNGSGKQVLTGNNSFTGGSTISGGTLEIGSGGIAGLVLGPIVNNASLIFNRSDVFSFDGNLSGTGTLEKNGTGTLTLNGVNTFTNTTSILAGILKLGSTSALGASTKGTSVTNGAVLDLNGINYAGSETLTLNGTGINNGGALINTSATAATYYGLLTLLSSTSIVCNSGDINLTNTGIILGSGFTLTLGGTGTGYITSGIGILAGSLVKQENGVWTLSASSGAFSGGTIVTGGRLRVTAATALGSGSVTVNPGSNLMFGSSSNLSIANNIILKGSSGNPDYPSLNHEGGTGLVNITGSITLDGNSEIGMGGSASNNMTINGVISGTGNLILDEANQAITHSIILNGANTYSGTTTISGGTVYLGTGSNIPNGSALIVNGNLDMYGFSETVGSLAGTGTIDNNAGASPVTLTMGENNTSTSYSGTILNSSQTLNLTKVGTGTFTLSGANNYKGITQINEGTLKLNNPLALGTIAGGTQVNAGASLDLGGTVITLLEPLTLNGLGASGSGALLNSSASTASYSGPIALGSTASIIGSSGTITLANSGSIVGPTFGLVLGGAQGGTFLGTANITSGTLTKQDPGTWTLGGNNPQLEGSLALSSGTLNLGSGLTHIFSSVTGNGAINFNTSNLNVTGNINLSNISSIATSVNTLSFTGTTPQTFTPNVSTNNLNLKQAGIGGTTVTLNSFTSPTLTISSGTITLGEPDFFNVTSSLVILGGGLNFSLGTLRVSAPSVDFTLLQNLTPGTGTLAFNASAGTQIFIPKLNTTHPTISHTGIGTLSLSNVDLICTNLKQEAGTLDLNGRNINVASPGFFNILNGNSTTLANLGGRTITVGGNASLRGFASNRLNLNPSTQWTLAVSGILKASNADIKNSLASISAGQADSSFNQLGNANWSFMDTMKPGSFAPGQDTLFVYEDTISRWMPRQLGLEPNSLRTYSLLSSPKWVSVLDTGLVFRPGSRDVGKFKVSLVISIGVPVDTLDMAITVLNTNDSPIAFPPANWQSPNNWKEDIIDTFTVVVVDMDINDTISLTTQLPGFIKYSLAKDTGNIYNRLFRFTVQPTQKDSGLVPLILRFSDKSSATSELNVSAKVISVNDMPTAVFKTNQVSGGAARFTFDVIDEDGSVPATRFHYRLISPVGDTLRRGIASIPFLELFPLIDGEYRLAVFAEDEGGLIQKIPSISPLTITGASTLVLDSMIWHMIGIPQASMPPVTLGNGVGLTSWDESTDNGQAMGRYADGKAVDSLRRGKGYWVKVAQKTTLTATQKELLDRPFTLRLTHKKQGWNQFSNPFPYPIDISSSKLVIWEWDASRRDLVDSKGILKPWAAYWVSVSMDTNIVFKNEPYFTPIIKGIIKTSSVAVEDQAKDNWTLQLALKAGPFQDHANFMGVRQTFSPKNTPASASLTRIADAPKYGEYIALHFVKPEDSLSGVTKGFSEDYHEHLDQGEEWWDFVIENSGSGFEQASLNLPGLIQLQSMGLNVFLVHQGKALKVASEENTILALDGNETHYSLVITPHADFAQNLLGSFNVSQNFPNPVVGQTTFQFNIPQSWNKNGIRETKANFLRLNIYDNQGKRVSTVTQGKYGPGPHAISWHPKNMLGAPLAHGTYFYRLETADFQKSLKMIIK
jgi:autotransporter-associated beta strand protein